MFRTARLTAATLLVCASAGLASQAHAGLSLDDPAASEALAAARAAAVCLPEKTAMPLPQKPATRKVVALSRQKSTIQFPLLLGVAY